MQEPALSFEGATLSPQKEMVRMFYKDMGPCRQEPDPKNFPAELSRRSQSSAGNRPKTAKALGASASRAVLRQERGRFANAPGNRSVGHGLRDINAFVDPVTRDRLTAMSPRTAVACAPRRARVGARRAAD